MTDYTRPPLAGRQPQRIRAGYPLSLRASFQVLLLNLPAVSVPSNSKGTLVSSINLVTFILRHVKRIRLLQTEKARKKVIRARQHVQRSRGEAGLPAVTRA